MNHESEIYHSHNEECKQNRTFQWELWQQCNNNCSFCVLGAGKKQTSNERKLKSLSDFNETLDNLDFDFYKTISLIGGEFFQGQIDDKAVQEAYFRTIKKLCALYKSGIIDTVYISATLTLGDQEDLYKTLKLFDDAKPHSVDSNTFNPKGIWVCTSWDPQGRFHTEKQKQNWELHVSKIKKEFPQVKLNTTIILTQVFCEMYLQDSFSPHDFMQKYNTSLAFTQTRIFDTKLEGNEQRKSIEHLEENQKIDEFLTNQKRTIEHEIGFRFFPDRKTFRKFLLKLAKHDKELFNSLFDLSREPYELHKNHNNADADEVQLVDDKTSLEACSVLDRCVNQNCLLQPDECKHPIAYATYSDCNECMICDKKQVNDVVMR